MSTVLVFAILGLFLAQFELLGLALPELLQVGVPLFTTIAGGGVGLWNQRRKGPSTKERQEEARFEESVATMHEINDGLYELKEHFSSWINPSSPSYQLEVNRISVGRDLSKLRRIQETRMEWIDDAITTKLNEIVDKFAYYYAKISAHPPEPERQQLLSDALRWLDHDYRRERSKLGERFRRITGT